MSRAAVLLILAGLAVGAGIGLYVGWVAAPVQYVDTAPNSLRAAFKDDYILMIATAFSGDGDLASARGQLAALGFADPGAAVNATAGRLAGSGVPAADQQRLAALAQALGAPSGATPAATASPTVPGATPSSAYP